MRLIIDGVATALTRSPGQVEAVMKAGRETAGNGPE